MKAICYVSLAALAAIAAGCSADRVPGCSSEEVTATLTKIVWDQVEQEFAATAGPQNAAPLAELARKNVSIQWSGITTTSKPGEPVTCQATATAAVPEAVSNLVPLQAALAREGGTTRLDGRRLVGDVEYQVTTSDDRKTTRVEARGFKTYAEVLGAFGSALYVQQGSAAATAPQTASAGGSPSSAASREVAGSAVSTTVVSAPSAAAEQVAPREETSAQAEFEAADKNLNEAYQSARASMPEAQKVALRDEQRAWIKRRDEACSEQTIAAQSSGVAPGGTAMEVEQLSCKAKLTADRAKQLGAPRK
jgi:uncharacterized protein YecT (DUF1311 family)